MDWTAVHVHSVRAMNHHMVAHSWEDHGMQIAPDSKDYENI